MILYVSGAGGDDDTYVSVGMLEILLDFFFKGRKSLIRSFFEYGANFGQYFMGNLEYFILNGLQIRTFIFFQRIITFSVYLNLVFNLLPYDARKMNLF